ncbi:MAG TPA: helix-turn-helix domain-containing protein [Microvirga sp.]|jgi:excisionase family DNA binding protein
MVRPRINPRLVKIHRTYTVEEASRLLNVHKNTVRAWIKAGLPVVDQARPVLIRGRDLRSFLTTCRKQRQQPCGPGEIYCVKCRKPVEPAAGSVLYLPITVHMGNLRGTCPSCGTTIHRRANQGQLGSFGAGPAITSTQASLRIGESHTPSLNCDSNEEAHSHADA